MLTMKRLQDAPEWIPEAENLYMRAFPANERIPFRYLIEHPSHQADTFIFLKGDRPAALACMVNVRDISHLTYLAVEENMRGKGYGTEILNLLTEIKQGRRIIVDIERPENTAGNEEQRVRRKNFYLHAGYLETSVRYTWQKEDYEILCKGGTITKEEFDQFWESVRS